MRDPHDPSAGSIEGVGAGMMRGRRARMSWAVALALCLLALRWIDPLPLELMRLRAFDLATAFCPSSRDASHVVAVDIDDAGLRAVGQWPWPRTVMARLVERLDSAGVRMVVFAVVFAEPDRWSPTRFGAASGLPAGLAEILGRLPDPDRIFAGSMRRTPVVLTQVLSNMPDRRSGRDGAADPVNAQGRFGMVGPVGSFEMPGSAGLIDNLPVLSQAAAGAGVAALVSDVDGAVRRVAAIVLVDGKLRAGLGPEAVRVAEKRSGFLIETNGAGPEALRIGERRVPVDADGWFRPRLCGLDSLPVVRAVDLLERDGGGELLRGKIAVVGVSARGIGTLWKSPSASHPVSPAILEAGVIDDLLEGRLLERPVFAGLLEILVALGGVAAVGWLDGQRVRRIVSFGLIAVSVLLALFLMGSGGLLFDWTLPALGLFLAPLAADMAERRYERAARHRKDRFMRQVVDASPDPILTIAESGEVLSCNRAATALGACQGPGLVGQAAAPLFGLSQVDLRYLIRRCLDGVSVPPVEVMAEKAGGVAMSLELAVGALDSGSVILIGRDITHRKEAQDRLARALADNETLLREVHHRVRNNLQGIWGVIALEKSALTDVTALERLSAIQDRLLVLGRIHEQLARTGDLARIDVMVQVGQLCRSFTDPRIAEGTIGIDVRVEPLSCHIETAMPLGLIINELVSDCLKSAFPDGRHGTITVRLGRTEDKVVLEVAGDGAEPWAKVPSGGGGTVGDTLLAALGSQLEATLESAGPSGRGGRVTMPGRLFD
jgi:PAS domain S-box-containing protein